MNSLVKNLEQIDVLMQRVRAQIIDVVPILEVLEARRKKAGNVSGKRRVTRRSAQANRQWKRQGRYLQAVRSLPKIDRLKVKRELRKAGYTAAIKLARSMGASRA